MKDDEHEIIHRANVEGEFTGFDSDTPFSLVTAPIGSRLSISIGITMPIVPKSKFAVSKGRSISVLLTSRSR